MVLILGGPGVLVETQRPQQRLEGAGGDAGAAGFGKSALVDVLDGEAAPQDLDKNLPELSGGHVVQEGIDDRAEVEEGVSHGRESHVAPEERRRPAGLGQRCHHHPTDLVGEPAQRQGGDNETCNKK